MCREIYNNKLAHMIMETGWSQDLNSELQAEVLGQLWFRVGLREQLV